MNPAHVHLLLNHIPVVGIWLGIVLYLVAMTKKPEWRSLSLWVFVLMAVASIPVYLSGEPAEEFLHEFPGISHAHIEAHEEAAVPAFILMLVLGAVALGGWMRFRVAEQWPRSYSALVLVIALAAGGMIGWTARLGAQIRHPEIRSQAAVEAPSGSESHGEPSER